MSCTCLGVHVLEYKPGISGLLLLEVIDGFSTRQKPWTSIWTRPEMLPNIRQDRTQVPHKSNTRSCSLHHGPLILWAKVLWQIFTWCLLCETETVCELERYGLFHNTTALSTPERGNADVGSHSVLGRPEFRPSTAAAAFLMVYRTGLFPAENPPPRMTISMSSAVYGQPGEKNVRPVNQCPS